MTSPHRIVMINHTHPTDKHVSAIRMRRFAECLATLGDHVLLMSPPPAASSDARQRKDVKKDIATHDWRAPMTLEIEPKERPVLCAARQGDLPTGFRQAYLAWQYALYGNVFSDWSDAVATRANDVIAAFEPDVIYATFGNTGNWKAADALSRRFHVPWIADMKDNFGAFVPFPLRHITASRFSRMSHMTAFSEAHAEMAENWFKRDKTVVYSGFDARVAPDIAVRNQVLIVGSLYAAGSLKCLIDGLELWASNTRAPANGRPVLKYAGSDNRRFLDATLHLTHAFECVDLGYLSHEEMMSEAASSIANMYVVNETSMFQHKIFELLASGRPIVTTPMENPEAKKIAVQVGGGLYGCLSAIDVADALIAISESKDRPTMSSDLDEFTWMSQAKVLRDVLSNVVRRVP